MNIIKSHFCDGFRAGRREHRGRWHVFVAFSGGNAYGIPWEKADEIAADLRRKLDESAGEQAGIVVDCVRVDMPDATYLLPLKLASELRIALIGKARECEEQEKAPAIAMDAAILHRAGFPVGLSNDPKIQAEAGKEAAWNTRLRQLMPGGVKSDVILGTPSIEVKEPS